MVAANRHAKSTFSKAVRLEIRKLQKHSKNWGIETVSGAATGPAEDCKEAIPGATNSCRGAFIFTHFESVPYEFFAPGSVVRSTRIAVRTPRETMIAAAFLISLAVYFSCGLLFAVPFALFGVQKIDPHAAHGSWGFRLLIVPGTAALWPLLMRRWLKGIHEPPEERNAHRCAAKL